MNELVTRFTELPNLHPALVHFPIALLPVAALFDLFTFRRGWERVGRAAAALYALAALGAGAAYWAGREAADSLPALAPSVELRLNEHSDAALVALWLVGVLAALRIGVELWDRQARRRALRALLLVAAAVGVVLVYRAADLGGGLVYRHGVAVAAGGERAPGGAPGPGSAVAPGDEASSAPAGGAAADRLTTGPDGALVWRPLAVDREALGSILKPAEGSDPAAVAWIEPPNEARGLGLAVDGEALLVLPGTFGDVQVEVELALDGFEGEAGPAHHIRGARWAGIFTVATPAGDYFLGTLDGETARELDRDSAGAVATDVRLTVSAIGRHSKGVVGGKTVVHGHEPALPAGACGLYLLGRGAVRILSMKVTPVAG